MSCDWEFKPGMRVVCIRPYTAPEEIAAALRWHITTPEKGIVYTLREVQPPEALGDGSGTAMPLLLAEIVNRPVLYSDGSVREPAFASTRFRPLDETRLDVFRNLLVDLPKEEELA
ncbi:hypothetical protein [Agrobacterium tumefaciens]|uniref:hypothetical protein n=1 Tax=Agrobacterium tumefaciens TaxID=358 RepID=UPI0015733F4A|nr:hypothetical protein [Agrobacterium tumefaciens]WCK01047.1 hypothetical protein G6L31_007125 [Agrobacterium tumefaciens]